MRELVEELRERLATARQGGSESARQKHTARGKLLVRDRIDLLLDPGTPFLEFSPLAALGMYGGDVASAGAVAGVGRINGRECVIVGNDARFMAIVERMAPVSYWKLLGRALK